MNSFVRKVVGARGAVRASKKSFSEQSNPDANLTEKRMLAQDHRRLWDVEVRVEELEKKVAANQKYTNVAFFCLAFLSSAAFHFL